MTPKPKAVSNKRRRSSSGGPQKRQRSQKLKDEQLSKPGKVVSANNLNWNSVKISKSIDVVEGFFGLEEIEGVDVKYVDGQARFVVKDDSKVKAEEEHDSTKVKKNTSLLTKEEEAELEKQDKERSLKRVDTIKQKTDKKKIQEGELLKQDSEEDEEEEFTGFSDGEHEEDAVATQQPLTILSDDEEIKDGGSKPESEDEIDEDLLEDYKENLHSNQLTNIIDEDDDINSVQLDPEFVENWSDRSLSRYTLNALSKLNFKVPTEVQKQCIPVAIGNHDIIGKASTGSGKTLAYGVPLLERFLLRLKENENKPLSAPVGIIFTPTRELAKQVYNHLIKVVEHYPLKNPKSLIVSITGGLSIQKQERLLTYNPGVIIATPGRLLEIIEMDNNDILNKLSKIEMLTLDEADRLLQDGHFGEMEKIIEVLNKIRMQNHYRKWQTLVFSATFSKDLFHKLDKNIKKNTDGKKTKSKKAPKKNKFPMTESITDDSEIISFLKTKLQFKDKEPKLVNVNPREIVSGTISEALIECDGTSRDLYLYYFLIMYTGSTLIFTNSIDSVKRLNSFLKFLNIRAYSIHSSMMQKQRLKNLENFQKSCAHVKGSSTKKETVVLIATDVAARGLDIPNIDHVVHYHLPRSADLYIHRSGRTGRAGNEGVSIMLCSPQEAGGPLRRLRTLIMDESMKMEKKALKQNSKDKVFDKALLSKFQHLNDDVKLLPIEVSILDQLKERSDIATELAESDVSKHSLSKEDSWVSKLAKDLEVDDISDFEDETLRKNRNKKQNKTLDSRVLQEKKFQLNKLLKEKLRFGAGSRKYISNGSLNMADVILKGKGHDNIVGYNSVDVIDVIKKSRNHQDRLQRLQEQKEAQKDKIKERKLNKDKKKDARKDVKRKKLEKTFGNGGNADDEDDDDYEDEDEE